MKRKNVPKRVANLICAIIQALALFVFVFSDYVNYYNYAIRPIEYDGFTYSKGAGSFGFFEALSSERSPVFVCTVVFLIVGIIMCIISALHNDARKDGISHIIISILALFFAGVSSTEIEGVLIHAEGWVETTVNMATQTLLIIFLGLAIVCNMVKRSNLLNPKVASDKASDATAYSPADEIKKYKELLDMGVISQEEFEAKKKQLLDL